jgi:hypothetical protein
MAVLADELVEVVEAAWMDGTSGDRVLDRAAGLGVVLAVAEAALAEEGGGTRRSRIRSPAASGV